jgi:hypothetical protein
LFASINLDQADIILLAGIFALLPVWACFSDFEPHHLSIIGEAIDEYHHSMINIGKALFFPAFVINNLIKQKAIGKVFNGNKRRITQPSFD